jgi:cysteine desulfurase
MERTDMDTKSIYLDNAATTRVAPEVVEAMMPFFLETYAVASSQFSHSPGILAKEGLDHAREILAGRLKASPEEIVFTSGGTESNNLALKGTMLAFRGKKDHLISTKIEHNSVLHSANWLEKEGVRTTFLGVNPEGFVDLDQLRDSITEKTFLVSVQHGNQEVGTLQDIAAIASICREKGVLFHTDASLSFGHLEIDLNRIPADLLTVSAHKLHGPKGVGALFVRKNTPLVKLNHGGYHEFDLRAGTENVAGIVGFGKAVELCGPEQTQVVRNLQKILSEKILARIRDVDVNGPKDFSRRLPGNVNVSFTYVEGESVVLHLDMKGVSVITGSACFSRSLEPSHVMMAMGFSHERAHGSIRFTLSRYNQVEEMERGAEACREVVLALRDISPLFKKE